MGKCNHSTPIWDQIKQATLTTLVEKQNNNLFDIAQSINESKQETVVESANIKSI